MKPYQHYKSSGIDWIGKIPEGWKINKLKYLVSCNNEVLDEGTDPNKVIQYVEISDVDSINGIQNKTEYLFKHAPSRARRVTQKGDIIVSTVRTYLNGIAYIDDDGIIVSTGFAVLRTKYINRSFLYYYVKSNIFFASVVSLSTGVGYPTITASQLINISIPVPPLSEQEAIAEYLDRKCGEIDRMTGKYERQIVLLKELKQSVISKAVTQGLNPQAPLRPSGIDWIGKIPEHWGIKKLKFVCTLSPKVNIKEKKCDIEVTFLPMENIRNGFFIPNQTSLKNYVSSYNLFEEGDILVAKVTPCFENGNIVIANNLTNGMGFASSEIFVFRVNTNDTKFVFYYFQNGNFKDRAVSSMTGSAGLRRIPAPFLMNEFIPVPPLSEQAVIVEYLDRKCGEIDGMIGRIERKIELLRELRKTLISEAVTGKIDVREEVAR